MSNPPTLTFPPVGGMKPVIIRIVVDLPAPFGPRKPRISPRSTENVTPATARFVPKFFSKFSTFIMRFAPVKSRGTGEWRYHRPPRIVKGGNHYIFVRLLPPSSLNLNLVLNPLLSLRPPHEKSFH